MVFYSRVCFTFSFPSISFSSSSLVRFFLPDESSSYKKQEWFRPVSGKSGRQGCLGKKIVKVYVLHHCVKQCCQKVEQKVAKFQKTPKDLHQSTFDNPKYLHQSTKRQTQNQFLQIFKSRQKSSQKEILVAANWCQKQPNS